MLSSIFLFCDFDCRIGVIAYRAVEFELGVFFLVRHHSIVMSLPPIVRATVQGVAINASSNMVAQAINAYRAQVCYIRAFIFD
jgi:hypothetical protein